MALKAVTKGQCHTPCNGPVSLLLAGVGPASLTTVKNLISQVLLGQINALARAAAGQSSLDSRETVEAQERYNSGPRRNERVRGTGSWQETERDTEVPKPGCSVLDR